jgi:redox-sensitive bicupin YhaK (pirin superfamily)
MGSFDKTMSLPYSLKKKDNGLYLFILEGNCIVEGQQLNKRDGFGIWNTAELNINAEPGLELLLMEVPMN